MSAGQQQNPLPGHPLMSMWGLGQFNNHGIVDARHTVNSNNVYNTDNSVDNRVDNSTKYFKRYNTFPIPLMEEELKKARSQSATHNAGQPGKEGKQAKADNPKLSSACTFRAHEEPSKERKQARPDYLESACARTFRTQEEPSKERRQARSDYLESASAHEEGQPGGERKLKQARNDVSESPPVHIFRSHEEGQPGAEDWLSKHPDLQQLLKRYTTM